MNSKLNLFKDKQSIKEINSSYITQDIINEKEEICNEIFENWQRCVKSKSWNDELCVGKIKPDYDLCIRERNAMQTKYDEQ